MAREIMSDTREQNAAAQAAPKPVSAVPPSAAPTLPSARDTLVGAFPEWDLVPTTHFVRRVK